MIVKNKIDGKDCGHGHGLNDVDEVASHPRVQQAPQHHRFVQINLTQLRNCLPNPPQVQEVPKTSTPLDNDAIWSNSYSSHRNKET